jgi:hypothetical protein
MGCRQILWSAGTLLEIGAATSKLTLRIADLVAVVDGTGVRQRSCEQQSAARHGDRSHLYRPPSRHDVGLQTPSCNGKHKFRDAGSRARPAMGWRGKFVQAKHRPAPATGWKRTCTSARRRAGHLMLAHHELIGH